MNETNQNYQSSLANQIETLQDEIAKLPRGSLLCQNTGKYRKYYHSIDGQNIYLSSKELPLAKQLALKMVLIAKLEDTLSEKLTLDAYIEKSQKRSKKVNTLLQKKPFLTDLLDGQPFFLFEEESARKWMEENYTHNIRYPELLVHRSVSGHFVRSESELMIDTALYMNKIPFRYECELEIGDKIFFPGFTIRHPATHDIFYWEHFEKMDESLYANNAFYKLHTYCEYGIFPSVSLITTYEAKSYPLEPQVVENLIHQYFM